MELSRLCRFAPPKIPDPRCGKCIFLGTPLLIGKTRPLETQHYLKHTTTVRFRRLFLPQRLSASRTSSVFSSARPLLISKTCPPPRQDYPKAQNRRPLPKAIPSDSLSASGADPSRRKDSLTLDCETTRGPVRVVAAGSCPFVMLSGAPQTKAPYRKLFASVSLAWIMEKPRTREGAEAYL